MTKLKLIGQWLLQRSTMVTIGQWPLASAESNLYLMTTCKIRPVDSFAKIKSETI
jgi:hypothetical protein